MSYLVQDDLSIQKFYIDKPEFPYTVGRHQWAVCDRGCVHVFNRVLENKVFSHLIIKVELKFRAINGQSLEVINQHSSVIWNFHPFRWIFTPVGL